MFTISADNVAFGRRAEQSSRAVINGGITNPSCAAVNGNIRHHLCFKSFINPQGLGCATALHDLNCILTAENDYQAYWTVDFGQAYTVISMKLYRRLRFGHGEEDEGKNCVCVPGVPVHWKWRKTLVFCILFRRRYHDSYDRQLSLCVQIRRCQAVVERPSLTTPATIGQSFW